MKVLDVHFGILWVTKDEDIWPLGLLNKYELQITTRSYYNIMLLSGNHTIYYDPVI